MNEIVSAIPMVIFAFLAYISGRQSFKLGQTNDPAHARDAMGYLIWFMVFAIATLYFACGPVLALIKFLFG